MKLGNERLKLGNERYCKRRSRASIILIIGYTSYFAKRGGGTNAM